MTQPKLRAFVAMRIGEKVTDQLYAKSIRPAVRSCGIESVRIDKIEYNEDVDARILEEVERADIIIADLTFARPSVYFEGGYASGLGKPVIYTARKDHFRDKDDDPHGFLRVHFDLQMKNIIDWSEPNSSRFRTRLTARIRHVARPLLQARKLDQEAAEAQLRFTRLSVSSRLSAVTETMQRFLNDRGFVVDLVQSRPGWPYQRVTTISGHLPSDPLSDGLVATRKHSGAIEAAWVRVVESMTLQDLRAMETLLAVAPPHDMNPPRGVRPNQVVEHVLLCSLRGIPLSRIHSALDNYDQVARGQFVGSATQLVPSSRSTNEVLLIGRTHRRSPLWEAVGFDMTARSPYPSGVRYDVDGDYLVKRPPRPLVFVFEQPPKPKHTEPKLERLAKVRLVPRRVVVHDLSGIDSVPDLESMLEKVSNQIGLR